MLSRLLRSAQKSLGRVRAPATVPIAPELWQRQTAALALLAQRSIGERERLRVLCAQFLAGKSINGAAGLVVTADMELHIAVQACLPILNLGLHWYEGWREIVVYPARFRVRRTVHDEDGLAYEMDEELSGEAWQGGPVVLSWADASPASPGEIARAAFVGNVVIHEFAHKLDLIDGEADGVPPFDRRIHPRLDRPHWERVLDDAYGRFCEEMDLVEAAIPRDVDPESDVADRYYAHLPLDPYAATDEGEFFAVSSEMYFLDPERIRAAFPEWHALLREFYEAGS
jgi:Mlc titration factor MtfA (ptsG expression regulator)